MKSLLTFNIGEELLLKPGVGVSSLGTIGDFISAILPNIYVFASIIVFFLLIGGGLMFIVSAGREDPEGAGKGRQTITAAIMGFILIFASYWIIQIIEVVTGIEILKPGF